MKRTELERKERELRKQQKKIDKLESIRGMEQKIFSESGAINHLFELFQFDEDEIFNINASDELLEFVLYLEEKFLDKQLENIFRKAIKKTKITEKQRALEELKALLN